MSKFLGSGQHLKQAIAGVDGNNSSFRLANSRTLGNVMDALLYCFASPQSRALNDKTPLAFQPRHLLAGRAETPLPSVDLRIVEDVVMPPCFVQERRSTARTDSGFMEDEFARDPRALVVANRPAVETANEPFCLFGV
jgi:hypothetical protein